MTEYYAVATAYINQWSANYDVEFTDFILSEMLNRKVYLVDVHQVLRTGRVVWIGMTGQKGSWIVRGHTIDDCVIDVHIAVSTEAVELIGFS